jgi:hypothetical protein
MKQLNFHIKNLVKNAMYYKLLHNGGTKHFLV